jgi:hypothetical protein
LRFSVLKEWLSVNTLGILHRASFPWHTANDLIAIIPSDLEAEAEILEKSILLIGTRGHAEKLAIPIRDLAQSSGYRKWFEPPKDQAASCAPAVLTRSTDDFELVAKGTELSARSV